MGVFSFINEHTTCGVLDSPGAQQRKRYDYSLPQPTTHRLHHPLISVIHRFLELIPVSKSLETLLDHLGGLYKFHGTGLIDLHGIRIIVKGTT
ncbi:hypothetical protein CRUP_024274 [Coryphaenoides rupestris]|nr:hypothetical protein CRUP_024274 [Coryphaenoides rupestris]